jgi:transcription-repair coupling factor (superfamily II helicase)
MAACRCSGLPDHPCSPASTINTFKERFQGFPIEIGRLSRLVPRRSKATREGLDGGQDRHRHRHPRAPGQAVEFKNLGLVIVDEEQRFGVTHKERLKAMRADVHVLTLTATPIPRTLQMAMSAFASCPSSRRRRSIGWRCAPT